MKYLRIKSQKNLEKFLKVELKKTGLNFISKNTVLPVFIRQRVGLNLYKFQSRVKFGCFLTYKHRSIFNHFKISRIKLRYLISNDYINGVKKNNF